MEKPYVVGIDIGGTNSVFGVVDARGTILYSGSIKTGKFADVNEVYATFFTDYFPARACVQVSALPKNVLVEIEAVASFN